MAISEARNWKQTVRDGAGKVLAERVVALPVRVSSVREEATRFLQYVVNRHGDLKISVESELQGVRTWLAELLKKMNSSRDPDEIRRLRGPMSAALALSSYLEQTLETGRTMTVGEFTAEALEKEAAKMPASWKEQADSLRRAAQNEREQGVDRLVQVWDVPSEDSNRL